MNIIEAILKKYSHYIILISSLDLELLEEMSKEISKEIDFKYLSFNHLSIDSNYDKLNDRVNDVAIKGNTGVVISSLLFPSDKLNFRPDIHINLSINKVYFDTIKNKYNYNDSIFFTYKKKLEDNKVNKYINIKFNINKNYLTDMIFYTIMDNIEKRLYGKFYDELSSKSLEKIKKPENNEIIKNDDKIKKDSEDDKIKKTEDEIIDSEEIENEDKLLLETLSLSDTTDSLDELTTDEEDT